MFPAPLPGSIAEVRANSIVGGQGKNVQGIVSWTSGVGTLIIDNDILIGSSSGGSSWGIAIGAIAEIDSNRINVDQTLVGKCTNTSNWCGGIVSYSSTSVVTNNVVLGVVASKSVGFLALEAEMPAGELVVNGNYLDGAGQQVGSGSGGTSAALALRTGIGVNAVVGRYRNNILSGGTSLFRWGVYEDQGNQPGQNARPEALENNDFFFPMLIVATTDVLYRDWDGNAATSINTILGVNSIPNVTTAKNFSADPSLGAGYHLSVGSPCIDTGTASEAPALDFEGEARPKGAGFDVGPDEAM
jgi:hypothetical protein